MKLSFSFSNGTSELTLIPESTRDKALIDLMGANDRPSVKLTTNGDGHLKLQTHAPVQDDGSRLGASTDHVVQSYPDIPNAYR